jgi:hypothetical protein
LILECSLKTQFPLLFELATDQDITVDKVIGYNRYYLFFRKVLNGNLRIQLNELYSLLSTIRVNNIDDTLVSRWKSNDIFSTHTLYVWLELREYIELSMPKSEIPHFLLKYKFSYG